MLLPIFLVVLADVFALTLVLPLLAIYAEHFGATPLQATLLVSVFAACQMVSGPMLGRLSDRMGRKPLLVLSQVGTLVGLLVMANAQSLAVLFLARIIDGATAGNLSLAQAYIADNTAPEDRTKSFAIIGIAFGLGFFLGPAITAWLATSSLQAPVYAAALLSLTSIVCTATLLRGGAPAAKDPAAAKARDRDLPAGRRLGVLEWGAYGRYFRNPLMAGLLGQFFLFAFAFATFTSGFSLFAERRFTWDGHPFTPREIGAAFAFAGFLGVLLQGGLIGRLVQRFGEARLVKSGFASMAFGYLLLGVVPAVGALPVVIVFASFGQGVLRPTITSLLSQVAEADEQGVVLGLGQSLTSLAQILAPPLGGFLLGREALGAWALIAALAAALGMLASRWGSGRHQTHPASHAAHPRA